MTTNKTYDVIILGTGMAGTILAAILSHLGVSVLMLERGAHPRFAIGESTTPETSSWLRVLAARYNVPEIAHIGPFQSLYHHVGTSAGIKRNFGFVFHRPGEAHRPEESTQSIIPDFPMGPESHVLRSDIDAYLLYAAIRYGAEYRSGVAITQIREESDGMVVEAEGAEVFRGRFVVDGGGSNSPLAAAFNLRETPTRMQTHSRAIYSHLLDVKPYDAVAPHPGRHAMPRWWADGTLHHIVKGGWMWIIPFNNHRWSTNPLCSVGLMLDPRVHPATSLSPEGEFRAFIQQYPSIAAQLSDATAARPWTRAMRLQYSSTRSTGARWVLLAHAYAFVDPLFSRGITNTMETIFSLVPRLCAALKEDRFSVERWADLEIQQRDMFDANDTLVAHSYQSFRSFELWNAWNRIWTLGIFYGGSRVLQAWAHFQATGNPAVLDALDMPTELGTLAPNLPGYGTCFDAAAARVRDAAMGRMTDSEAASAIFRLVREAPFNPPALRLADPEAICTDFRLDTLIKVLQWARSAVAPPVVRPFFDVSVGTTLGQIVERLRSPQLMIGQGALYMPPPVGGGKKPTFKNQSM